ncbi:MAG TPA: hypothetical protein VGQ56_19440 [Gemmatimonadaceae bacterium]|nr:hypothetical protein [Gemmatimonadaceae bacterium]
MKQRGSDEGCGWALVFVLCLGVAVFFGYYTYPVFLWLLTSGALLFITYRSSSWLHGLVPFLIASTTALGFVWLVSYYLAFYRDGASDDQVSAAEARLIHAHEWVEAHTSLTTPLLIAMIAILGIISYYLPKTKLLSRAMTVRKWIESVNIALLIVTSFTFMTGQAVAGRTGAARIRESRAREAESEKRHLIADAAREAMQEMKEPDRTELARFAIALARDEQDVHLKAETLALRASRQDFSPGVEVPWPAGEPPRITVDEQMEREQKAEASANEAEQALRKVIEQSVGSARGKAVEVLWDIVMNAAGEQGSAFGALAKAVADKVVDAAAEPRVKKVVDDVANAIIARLPPRSSVTPDSRAHEIRTHLAADMISNFEELTRERSEAAKYWHGGQQDEKYALKYDEVNRQLETLYKDMSDADMINFAGLKSGARILAEVAVPPARLKEFRQTESHFEDLVPQAREALIPPRSEREKRYAEEEVKKGEKE